MDRALRELYREFGYTGPQPEAEDKPRTRGIPSGVKPEAAQDLPPLDEKELRRMEALLKDKPDELIAQFNKYSQHQYTEEEVRHTLSEAARAFAEPKVFLEEWRAQHPPTPGERTRGIGGRKPKVPRELILYPDIEIDPDNHRFEPLADVLGWAFNSGYQFLREKVKASFFKEPFVWHHDFDDHFKYEMKDRQGRPLDPEQKISFALFADFGTGLYHSRYIAKNIEALQPEYAIHLGDVYYSGRSYEFENNFNKPLQQVIKNCRFFAMNANHEMYSGSVPYFSNIYKRRSAKRGWLAQEQEGSYFCIWNKNYQIIGIDTAYYGDGRLDKPALNDWLGQRLREGKEASPKRTNILLSPNEPYELGKGSFTKLYSDLEPLIKEKLIDFMFWGNTHYCALFDKSPKTPFIGSCIGHAGHPIYKADVESNELKHRELPKQNAGVPPALWVDLSSRFPEHTGLRPDLANNGFCMLELEKDKVRLIYYDWLKKVQHEVSFSV